MGLSLKIHFEKPGTMLKETVDIPIKFTENPDIMNLVNRGYYYVKTDVRAYP